MGSPSTVTFDATQPYELSDAVSLRDESFGALAYHHVTRRLVFLKSRELVALVRRLGEFDSAHDATCALVAEGDVERYLGALANLARSGLVRGR